jgi:hypothetical protein
MRDLGLLLLLLPGSMLSAMENNYTTTIKHEINAGQLTIQPIINSPKQETLHYELVSAKHGKSGVSKTSQSGSAQTQAGRPLSLATLKLGLSNSDHYTITLRVYAGDVLVGVDEIHYP